MIIISSILNIVYRKPIGNSGLAQCGRAIPKRQVCTLLSIVRGRHLSASKPALFKPANRYGQVEKTQQHRLTEKPFFE